MRHIFLFIVIALIMSGCVTYIVPCAKADIQDLTPPDIQASFATKPSNPFLSSLAEERVQ